jgi:hypothetical protein
MDNTEVLRIPALPSELGQVSGYADLEVLPPLDVELALRMSKRNKQRNFSNLCCKRRQDQVIRFPPDESVNTPFVEVMQKFT